MISRDAARRFVVKPIARGDLAGLEQCAADSRIWMLNPAHDASMPSGFRAWAGSALGAQANHGHIVFTIMDAHLDLPIGSTRFMPTDEPSEIEIGATWIGVGWWGSGCNDEAKCDMIDRAFDLEGYRRIRLVIDSQNQRSVAAVTKLGAYFRETRRRDRVCHDGRVRDALVFALDREVWRSALRASAIGRIEHKASETSASLLRQAVGKSQWSIVEIGSVLTHDLRHEVLRPGQPRERVRYEEDTHPGAWHLGAVVRGRIVGVASFYQEPIPAGHGTESDARLRGMAVRPDLQRLGIGRELIASAIGRLAERGTTRIWCNARTTASGYYANLGFQQIGDEFDMPSIGPHRRMVLDLKSMTEQIGPPRAQGVAR